MMPTMSFKLNALLLLLSSALLVSSNGSRRLQPPIVINTWNFTQANARAWAELAAHGSALDAVEMGCGQCEIQRCDGTVGWGGSPSESGETTLDAMIMDGETYDVGAVGGLRRVRGAIKVARLVLERTSHTLLVGEMATEFALELGMEEQTLMSNESRALHRSWLEANCQPNYWKNVRPDPRKSCGPYNLLKSVANEERSKIDPVDHARRPLLVGHDTIGMVARDSSGRLASGTSTNGLRYKISGRVGDSPVPGAGSYAARDAGAAAATGDGDVMMRHLLSFAAVESLRRGMGAGEAAHDVMAKQAERTGRPYAHAALVVLSNDGSFGAACTGYTSFPFVVSDALEQVQTHQVECMN